MVVAKFSIDGLVDKPDIIGAVFGQTEGLLGDQLDLRELQKSGKIGRIEIEVNQSGSKTFGKLLLPASLDRVETCILGAAVESVDRVGPFEAHSRSTRSRTQGPRRGGRYSTGRRRLIKQLLLTEIPDSKELAEMVQSEVKSSEISAYGPEHLPAGPDVGEEQRGDNRRGKGGRHNPPQERHNQRDSGRRGDVEHTEEHNRPRQREGDDRLRRRGQGREPVVRSLLNRGRDRLRGQGARRQGGRGARQEGDNQGPEDQGADRPVPRTGQGAEAAGREQQARAAQQRGPAEPRPDAQDMRRGPRDSRDQQGPQERRRSSATTSAPGEPMRAPAGACARGSMPSAPAASRGGQSDEDFSGLEKPQLRDVRSGRGS